MRALYDLALAAGLDPAYLSWRQDTVTSSDESLTAALRALAPDLGVGFAGPDDAAAALAALEAARWAEVVPPVVVGWDGALAIPFSVPAQLDDTWEVEVATEAGHTIAARGRLYDLPADGHASPGDGAVYCVRHARIDLADRGLPGAAPLSDRSPGSAARTAEQVEPALGYHTVRWRTAGVRGEAFAIAAPRLAWGGPGAGPRRWGVFAPVYGLADSTTGQAGDLGALRRLFAQVARRGGRYVATLPILAAFLDEPCMSSPYSPASRMFWNELYLDLAALAGELGVAPPAVPPIAPGAPIDYRTQYHWRRLALDPMAERLFATRGREIDAWASQAGVYDYAAFRAIGETTKQVWRDWPAQWRDGAPLITSRSDAIGLGADAARVTSHAAAQWAMQRQLDQLTGGPVSLYLDLPVGVNASAYDVWRYRALFVTELSAGAPPDALFLGGQDWGLPPLSPSALRRDHYRYFIRCVRHHIRVSGMLRIDHVMGLFRLYCVPHGRPATDGVYVRYPYEELLAILALESSRARCALVGEDLGTVPDAVRPAMARHGLFRLHVGQWHLPARPGESPAPSPAESVASLNTHDTPTFAGWWRGADIDDRSDLGLITPAEDAIERTERDRARAALLGFVEPRRDGEHLTEVERAMVGATADLAAGPAEVVLVALDDLALDPQPHNVPGTTAQRPNWQRRVEGWSSALDESRAAPPAAAAIAAVIAARPRSD
jgi:4-alpha-glucanotransferase